jgi:hypothetical protein
MDMALAISAYMNVLIYTPPINQDPIIIKINTLISILHSVTWGELLLSLSVPNVGNGARMNES